MGRFMRQHSCTERVSYATRRTSFAFLQIFRKGNLPSSLSSMVAHTQNCLMAQISISLHSLSERSSLASDIPLDSRMNGRALVAFLVLVLLPSVASAQLEEKCSDAVDAMRYALKGVNPKNYSYSLKRQSQTYWMLFLSKSKGTASYKAP